MSESEALEVMSRVALTVAGRLGEQLARAREQELRRAQGAEEQQARELQGRFDAERAAARAQLAPVMDNRWWDTASGRDIERVHEAATAWRDHDPAARDAAEEIRDQVQRRYGLQVNNLAADEASVAAALAKAEPGSCGRRRGCLVPGRAGGGLREGTHRTCVPSLAHGGTTCAR